MIMILILEEADYWNKYFPIGVSEKQTKALVGFFAAFSRSPCSDIPVLHFCTALFFITSFMIKFRKTLALSSWKSVLYESTDVENAALCVSPSANSLFWKLESNVWVLTEFFVIKKMKKPWIYPVLV